MDGDILFFTRHPLGGLGGEECGFAKAYARAHQDAGIKRLPVAPVLAWMNDRLNDPFRLDEELEREGGPVTRENADRVKGNLMLAHLFQDLLGRMEARMAAAKAERAGPFQPLPPQLPQAQRLTWVRAQACVTLNKELDAWGATLAATPAPACPFARMAGFARRFFKASPLYRRADHDLISIAKTGSNTALHMCFSLVEGGLKLGLRLPDADWRGVMWRSRKDLKTLASGSLGMIVTFLHASGLEPDGESAVNSTIDHDSAFRLERGVDGMQLRLDTRFIAPFSTGHDRLYTGCPAFHVAGMIEMYLRWVLDIAECQGLTRPDPAEPTFATAVA